MSCANPKTATASDTIRCVATGVPNVDGVQAFQVFPNPASSVLVIHLKLSRAKKLMFTIDDINGRRVFTSPSLAANSNFVKTIDISNLPQGCYYLITWVGAQKLIDKVMVY